MPSGENSPEAEVELQALELAPSQEGGLSLYPPPGAYRTNGRDAISEHSKFRIDGAVSRGWSVKSVTVGGKGIDVGAGNRFSADYALEEGLNEIEVRVYTSAGRVLSAIYCVMLDSYCCLCGVSARIRNRDDLAVTGYSEPKAAITVQARNAATGKVVDKVSVTAGPCGQFSAHLHSRLPAGSYRIEVQATDWFDNSASETARVRVGTGRTK
jgi:hypothetical protein